MRPFDAQRERQRSRRRHTCHRFGQLTASWWSATMPGLPPNRTAPPVYAMKLIGCEALLLTSAVGSLREECAAGSLVCVTDHINLMGVNPLVGHNDPIGPRFPDMQVGSHYCTAAGPRWAAPIASGGSMHTCARGEPRALRRDHSRGRAFTRTLPSGRVVVPLTAVAQERMPPYLHRYR
jgi:hypothetical protein